jgi:hypothetical protein
MAEAGLGWLVDTERLKQDPVRQRLLAVCYRVWQ